MTLKENPAIINFCKNSNLIATVFLISLLSSCVTQRKVEYLQDKDKNIKTFSQADFPDYKLKPNDELYIRISSLDEAATNIFSNAQQNLAYTGSITPYGASLLSFSVDKEGFLPLPVIGKIFVRDKTLADVSSILKDSLSHVLSQPVVTLKLVNRFVSIIGEVRNPGNFNYTQDKLTIYDGLGLAGDILDYGDRKNVILVRNENGENRRININLNNSNILASDYYYLRPNDIVYVKPLREKFWEFRPFPWYVFFSAITTGLLIYNIVKPN